MVFQHTSRQRASNGLGNWLIAVAALWVVPVPALYAQDERGAGPSLARGASEVTAAVDAQDKRSPTVGLPARIDQIVLAGTELEVRPREDRRAPLVVRIVNTFRHGTAYRYDLVYYGLEPGEYDLKSCLRRKDGSPTDDLPPIPVTIRSVLPAGQVEPNPLRAEPVPFPGGYQVALWCAGIAWAAGLAAIVLVGCRRRRATEAAQQQTLTLADRLQPMVEDALAGRLDRPRQAELERMLLAWWRKRLDLEGINAAEAIARLRNHEEAGALLRQLEAWLHRRVMDGQVDVAALLEPYRQLPTEAVRS